MCISISMSDNTSSKEGLHGLLGCGYVSTLHSKFSKPCLSLIKIFLGFLIEEHLDDSKLQY